MKSILSALAVATLLSLSGCAAVQTAVANDPELQAQAVEDLDAAIKIADAAKDKVAVACFQALKDHVPAVGVSVETKGPVSVYAKLRVTVRGVRQSQVPEAVHLACAPLVVDAAKTGASLMLLFK